MEASPDTWTTAHDLSLVYIALAYGTDNNLSDEELSAIVERLDTWDPPAAALLGEGEGSAEVVMEAMAVYLEDDGRDEVAASVEALGKQLGVEARRHALEDAMRIAEADGVLLSSEQNLLTALADAWNLRSAARTLIGESTAMVEAADTTWSLLHDLALVYVVVAHSTDEELSGPEIAAILGRMSEWHPEVSEEDAREVLREVLTFYAEQPSEEALEDSVRSVKETLPSVQRLVVLNDLVSIAAIEGENEHKQAMIEGLADAWNVPVRMQAARRNGRAPSS